MGSNVDMSSPLLSPSEKLEKEIDEEKKREEDRERDKKNTKLFDKMAFNIRGLVRGFTSLFGGGISNMGSGNGTSSNSDYLTSSGNGNEEKVWNFFKAKGVSDEATAGIMGNIYQESKFDPTASEKGGTGRDDSGGYGLIQWTGGRRQKLFDAAKEQGKDVNDIDFQLNYLWNEVFSDGSYYKNQLDKTDYFTSNDVSNTTHLFHKYVEGSADTQEMIQNNRIEPAKGYYDKYKGTGGSSGTSSNGSGSSIVPPSSNSGTSSGISSSGSHFSTGVADITPAEQAVVDWFLKYKGTMMYGQGNSDYPLPRYDYKAGGSADCSSLYGWALENGTNGKTDVTHYDSTYSLEGKGQVIWSGSKPANQLDTSIMRPGDAILYNGHVDMYLGNGLVGNNGGTNDNNTMVTSKAILDQEGGKGIPIIQKLSDKTRVVTSVRRYITDPNSYKDAGGTYTGSGSGGTSNTGGSFTGNGVFDSTFAITEEERNQVEAENYWKDLREQIKNNPDLDPIHALSGNNIKKDIKDGKVVIKKTSGNTSGWNSDWNKYNYGSSDKGNTFDPNKSTGGKSPWEIIHGSANNNSGESTFNPGTGGGTSGNGNGNNNGDITYPDRPDNIPPEQMEYFEKLMKVLNLIEKNTSNIPQTNVLLNEIIELIEKHDCCGDGNSGDSGNTDNPDLPNVNIESLFGAIDADIRLIASGI